MTTALIDILDTPEAADGTAQAAKLRAAVRDDALNILRIATLISLDRSKEPAASITRACQEELPLLEQTAPIEIRQELDSTLVGRDVDAALEWLQQIGFLALIMPEVDATRDLAQEGGRKHKDVWEHTKLVVRQAVPRKNVRWAALLHDIGKVPTRTFTKSGVHFHGHAEVGARMFDKMARRIPFDKPDRKAIRFLIKYHLRSNQYSAQWSDSAVRRFGRDMDAYLVDLLDLSRADITSQRPGRRRQLLHQISELSGRIQDLRDLDAKQPPLPKGVGSAIMSHFGLAPTRFIGDLKRALEQAIDSGELEERREDEYYIKWLESSGLVTPEALEQQRRPQN